MSKKKSGCLFWFINDIMDTIYILFNPKSKSRKQPKEKVEYTYVDHTDPVLHEEEKKEYKYRRRYLLTKNELYFYKELKRIADKLNLTVLAKIRMADLVEPKSHGKDYYGEFGKIKAKHVDFALCNPDNLYVLLLIEVDDNSHDTKEGTERDEFVEVVYKSTGYTLYRARGTANLERDITEIINSQK